MVSIYVMGGVILPSSLTPDRSNDYYYCWRQTKPGSVYFVVIYDMYMQTRPHVF